MNLSLNKIEITCSICQEAATADDINQDIVRYHTANGNAIRFPSKGIHPEQYEKLKEMTLLCECCQEEKEENE